MLYLGKLAFPVALRSITGARLSGREDRWREIRDGVAYKKPFWYQRAHFFHSRRRSARKSSAPAVGRDGDAPCKAVNINDCLHHTANVGVTLAEYLLCLDADTIQIPLRDVL